MGFGAPAFRAVSAYAIGWLGGGWLLLQRLPGPVEDAPVGTVMHLQVIGGLLGGPVAVGVAAAVGWVPARWFGGGAADAAPGTSSGDGGDDRPAT